MSGVVQRAEVLDLLRRMENAGALTATALDLSSKPDLDLGTFEALARFLGRLHDGSKFWIADLLLKAEGRFGEAAYQIAAATGRSERTLGNWIWVASKVPPSRRREGLTFTHHYLVAALPPAQQSTWLTRAQEQGLASRELQEALRAQREIGSAHGAMQPDCEAQLDAAVDVLGTQVRACYGPVPFEVVVHPAKGAEVRLRPTIEGGTS
jgi:hypothetical protein